MKFLCDRCKTRYSIGDDRVRGKILKIRCKNCANVIAVREGMSDVDAADPQGLRKRGTTQAVPLVTPEQAGLAASAPPPPALEQEWYVSIDGAQEGPFALGEAQRWVAGKAFDAELHCWSEGFDDWLPVDKVSHFRGLRRKPAPAAAPPPLPRAVTSPVRAPAVQQAAAPQRPTPEPKPLFAATMASLERDAAAASPAGFGLPTPGGNGASRPAATPPGGERAMPMAAKNGTPHAPAIAAKIGSNPAAGASASKLAAFDLGDQPTQLQSQAFDDEPAAANDLFAKALGVAAPPATMPLATPAPSTTPTLPASSSKGAIEGEDDLQIGEVSRVVNLADLKPRPKPITGQRPSGQVVNNPAAALNRTGSVPRLGNTAAVPRIGGNTAAVPRIGGNTAAVPRIDDPNAPMMPVAGDSMLAVPPQVATSHRRGLLMLIGAAAVVLIGGGVAVGLLVFGGDDNQIESGLGRGRDIDTTRPDDPLRRIEDGSGSGSGSQVATTGPIIKRPNNTGGSQRPQTMPKDPDPPPGGDKLGGDEIEAMARTNGAGTQRCYMRAQRGAEAIMIGDVKKVLATLTIAPDGKVTGVSLDKHGDNSFGKCLIGTISGWKFRTSPGGTYRLTLQFVST